jgi:ubiquinone/menaquinone biosynthesis C-methylase UbiE
MIRPQHQPAPIVKKYARLARRYDKRWAYYVDATARETARRLCLKPGEAVLDVGCGTGALLSLLSRMHSPDRLCGVEPIAQMLAVARRRLDPRVALCRGWAQRLPFADQRFDVVVCCNVFHYLRAAPRALREMRRVVRSGGRVVITDWCDDYLACRVCDWFLRRWDPAHAKAYRSDECVELLRSAGHAHVDLDRYKISWLWGLMTAQAHRPTA